MQKDLEQLKETALAELNAARDNEDIEKLRVLYLGRKGKLTQILKSISDFPEEERPLLGQLANKVKNELADRIGKRAEDLVLEKHQTQIEAGGIDITIPGRRRLPGHLHPLSTVCMEICDIFLTLGFEVAQGPDIELDYYNFEALNFPKDHPARDMQATLFVSDDVLLRTHTSPVQVRVMEKRDPPIKVIAPGRVYRHDYDVSHSPMFSQVEGLLVGEDITFGDLKGILTTFVHRFFSPDIDLRFRPSFFPFTEPSAEIDIQCVMCGGEGCRVCGQTGWLEILGSGMVDPAVYEFVGYDPEKVSGFAFGMGIERIAMLKYGIDDIRLFFENDLRFLRQF